jgi:hypothetical protein
MDFELLLVKAGVAHLQSTPLRSASWELGGGRTQGEEQNNQKIKGTRDLTD